MDITFSRQNIKHTKAYSFILLQRFGGKLSGFQIRPSDLFYFSTSLQQRRSKIGKSIVEIICELANDNEKPLGKPKQIEYKIPFKMII